MKLLAALLLTAQLLIVPVIQVEAAEKRPLIIFFSLTGNTNAIAAETARLTGGDLFRIVQAKPYPSDYNATTEFAKKEQADNARPEMKVLKAPRLAEYDTVIFASPNWWSSLPMPVMTFLDANDLSGKKVFQIISHGGYGPGDCMATLCKAAPKASFAEPFVTEGKKMEGLSEWLKKNGLIK